MSKQVNKKATMTESDYLALITDNTPEAMENVGEDKLIPMTITVPKWCKDGVDFSKQSNVNYPFVNVHNVVFVGRQIFSDGEYSEYTMPSEEGPTLLKGIGVQWTVNDDEERHFLGKTLQKHAGKMMNINVYRERWQTATNSGENIKVYSHECPTHPDMDSAFGIRETDGNLYCVNLSEIGQNNVFKPIRKKVFKAKK